VFSVATTVVVHPRATVCEGIPGRLVYRCCVDAWRLGDVNVRLYLFHLFITGVALRCHAEQKERWAAIASPGRTGARSATLPSSTPSPPTSSRGLWSLASGR